MSFTIRVRGREFEVRPSEESLKPVHPALDIVDGVPYIGLWKEVEIYKDGEFIDTDRLLFLVSPYGEILYEKSNLAEHGLKPMFTPVEFDNWWSGKIVDVDPKTYYEEVFNAFKYYIDAHEDTLHLLSLWTIGTIFHVIFPSYGYLYLHGVRRSGKTKILTLIKCLGFNAVRSHSISEATLYRLIQVGRAVLLLDEQDYLSNPERKSEFRTLLLGGYKKGSFVYRSEKTSKGKIIPQRFMIYAPKALANIEGLEDVLMDRTIVVTTMRTNKPEIARREPDEDSPVWLYMRDKLASLFMKYHAEVEKCYEDMKTALGDNPDVSHLPEGIAKVIPKYWDKIYARNREIWLPVLSMALFFEKHGVNGLVERMLNLASKMIEEKAVDEIETPEVGLATALLRLVKQNGWYALSDIADMAKEEMGLERIDSRVIGRMMKRIGFKNKVKKGGRIFYWLTVSQVEDVAKRIIPDYTSLRETLQTEQTPETLQMEKFQKAARWVKGRIGFSSNDIAIYLGVSRDEARQIIEAMLRSGLVVQLDEDLYRPA